MAGGTPIDVTSALGVFLQAEYGGIYAVSVDTVLTAPGRYVSLAPTDFERMWVGFILQESTGPLQLTTDNDPGQVGGIYLNGIGAALIVDARQDLALAGYSWFGYAPSNGVTVQVIQVSRVAR